MYFKPHFVFESVRFPQNLTFIILFRFATHFCKFVSKELVIHFTDTYVLLVKSNYILFTGSFYSHFDGAD